MKTIDYAVSQEAFQLEFNDELNLYKTTPVPKDLDSYYESSDYISHTDAKTTTTEI